MTAFAAKICSRRGFTLTELLVAAAIMSLFSMAAVTLIFAAFSSSEAAIAAGEADMLADTLSAAARDILMNAENPAEADGVLRFDCPRYSGYEMSLRESGGRLEALIFNSPGGSEAFALIPEAAYAGFSAGDFSFSCANGVFALSFTLSKSGGRYEKPCDFRIPALNR